jgi:LmbE family N-acetylglucosaminyl deacetylase
MDIDPDKLKNIRRIEAENAADVIGAELISLEYEDEFLIETKEVRLDVINVIRKVQPDIIITHHPEDYHPDHRETARIIFAASFVCTIPNVRTEHEHCEKIPPVFYMDSISGVNFNPEVYVDITDTFDLKVKALSCHESQVDWLKHHDNIDIIEFMTVNARNRGIQCNTKYAEGFIQLKTWPRNITERLLP